MHLWMLEHDLWQFEQIFNNTEEFIYIAVYLYTFFLQDILKVLYKLRQFIQAHTR